MDAGRTPGGGPGDGRQQQVAERFFRRIEQSGALPGGVSPEVAASAVLCALSLRVTREQQSELLATLPGVLLDRLDACVIHAKREASAFDRETFLGLIDEHLGGRRGDAESVARAVLGALRYELDSEARHAAESQLPSDLLDLWHGYDTLPGAGPGPELGPAGR